MQRPAIRSGHELLLGLCGSSQRLIGVDKHPGMQLGLSRFDPLECRLHDLDR